jgi:CRP/FNR family cyclic AMP-dependent transcriptional regulator
VADADNCLPPDRDCQVMPQGKHMDIDGLVQAMQSSNAEDAFRARLSLEQWRTVAPYLARHEIRAGDSLLEQGKVDRTTYFLERGGMQVFVGGAAPGSHRVAILRAGAVIGESGLFGDSPRLADVAALTPSVVWALRPPRMEELVQRSPTLALELLRAAGALMLVRMRAHLSRQVPMI